MIHKPDKIKMNLIIQKKMFLTFFTVIPLLLLIPLNTHCQNLTYQTGHRQYQCADHLGNVQETVSDKKIFSVLGLQASVSSYSDYFPFGMVMPERKAFGGHYRYSFNGMEKDDEVKGSGNSIDFGARLYDARLGRWLSMDPLDGKYPYFSPYNFAANMPTTVIDVDGRDIWIVVTSMAGAFPGADGLGHMAIAVGSEELGAYYIFSIELKGGADYVLPDEVIFTTNVLEWQGKLAKKEEVEFYSHCEEDKEVFMEYIAANAPGTQNTKPGKEGSGYDRMIRLKDVTPEQEAQFLEFLLSKEADGYIYKLLKENCASYSMELINLFFDGVIKDKNKVDFPNKEFDKLEEDTDNWEVTKDNKEANDEVRTQNKKTARQNRRVDRKAKRKLSKS